MLSGILSKIQQERETNVIKSFSYATSIFAYLSFCFVHLFVKCCAANLHEEYRDFTGIKMHEMALEWQSFYKRSHIACQISIHWSGPITHRNVKEPSVGWYGTSVDPNWDTGRYINEPNQTRILATVVVLTSLVLLLMAAIRHRQLSSRCKYDN